MSDTPEEVLAIRRCLTASLLFNEHELCEDIGGMLERYAELLEHIAKFEVDVMAIIEEYERESSMDVKLPGGAQ